MGAPEAVRLNRSNPWPTWIESTWVESDNVVLAWYHQEHFGVCPGTNLSIPLIGAAISYDGGNTFFDQGTVLSSPDPVNCSSRNGYFAGGHGDFSVILDRNRKYFYFLFSNYAGPVESQGVAIARLAFANRYYPAGNVMKYYAGYWTEPGVRGRVTPIFPAKVSWQQENTNSLWGPSVHWNTYLESYVVLLNRSCCTSGWPQNGIYISFGAKLSDPASWTTPKKILQGGGWYPQVIGLGPNGTDSRAGRVARFYMYGHSDHEIVFDKPPTPPETPPVQ